MTPPGPGATPADPSLRLFEPGQRLGWVYRDPEALRRPFPEPEPRRQPVPVVYENRAAAARIAHENRKQSLTKAGGVLALGCLLLSLLAGGSLAVLALVVAGVCVALVVHAGQSADEAARVLEAKRAELEQHFQYTWQAWWERGRQHATEQDERVRNLGAWGALPVRTGTRRIDVFGGSRRGREGFLTVFGTSTLRQRPVIVVDLTQALVCQELSALAEPAGFPLDVQLLPSGMAGSDILSGLTPQELVNSLVEAVHAEDSQTGRAARTVDTMILDRLCGALGEDITPARLGAGLRALMGEAEDTKALTRAERNRIADDLLADSNKDRVRDSLVRLAAFLHPLERLGADRAGHGPGHLTCIALDPAAGSAGTEMLADLAVQSVTRRLASSKETVPAVVVALGEQGLQRRCLEQLANVCEHRGAQLTFLHPHLREGSVEMIGGGTVAFMRLGNHQEAGVAADFLGRRHSFVLHSLTDTEGEVVNTSVARTLGSSTSSGTTHSDSVTDGSNWGRGEGSRTHGGSRSRTSGTSTSTTRTTNESTTHTTGDSRSTGTAHSEQRVYEYVVEPTRLQALTDFGLLLVERGPDGSVSVHPADCNPNIALLDQVGTQPLPPAGAAGA
ncbi:hypothetical protein [Streptomyces sp. ITFR-16]|uniref:hypothetical protein n=1 Tax=Streptomyces sp. ITFR-16 TaxID=3075198 RepID=UPI002889EE2C|nr:hypothetical protein [Streptomyces sp. ITFR-16]WNI20962.1 hypothetical protein RLT58_03055 [Streptomyces sp. ITFR-16]